MDPGHIISFTLNMNNFSYQGWPEKTLPELTEGSSYQRTTRCPMGLPSLDWMNSGVKHLSMLFSAAHFNHGWERSGFLALLYSLTWGYLIHQSYRFQIWMYQREFVGRAINILFSGSANRQQMCPASSLGIHSRSYLGPNRCHALLQNDAMETLSIWDQIDLGLILPLTQTVWLCSSVLTS